MSGGSWAEVLRHMGRGLAAGDRGLAAGGAARRAGGRV